MGFTGQYPFILAKILQSLTGTNLNFAKYFFNHTENKTPMCHINTIWYSILRIVVTSTWPIIIILELFVYAESRSQVQRADSLSAACSEMVM